ncbi:hypothetical protein FIL88_06710 [Aliiroseovarius halocynthiae]|uniref:Chalcone isomerase domain-containing protein n=2 Tax=Aliiroseovarius halocynthiae TaxID=985055 RepID=A0A545SX85_9RHOB|nr:hypothetical protein FIL88_06710 [Aliiroseovarius halocynthiae]
MRKIALVLLLVTAPIAACAQSAPQLPGSSLRGEATFRYLGFPLYDARLFTPGGAALDWAKPFALELRYRRNLTQFDLVESTMRELKRTGGAIDVRDGLTRCFKDVRKGDRFTAVAKAKNTIGFWLNGQATCTLDHPNISRRFMEIFLGEKTRSKSFTRALKAG